MDIVLKKIDLEILTMLRKGVLGKDICHRLNITDDDYKFSLCRLKSYFNKVKTSDENLENLPKTKLM